MKNMKDLKVSRLPLEAKKRFLNFMFFMLFMVTIFFKE